MHFGAALRLLRIDSGVSLRALAAQIGVSSAYLSRVEHGYDAVPTPDRLSAIARALGLPPTLLTELAHQVDPFVSRYLESVPVANVLFLEIARRDLSASQLARVKAFIDAEFPQAAGRAGRRPGRLSGLLSPERVVLQLSCTDIDDVVDVAASRLLPAGSRLSPSAVAEEILRREREASTALGSGVAVPHAFLAGAPAGAVAVTLARPLDVATPDGLPLRLLVVLLGSKGERQHLDVLAEVARLASHNAIEGLCACRDPEQLIAQIAQFEAIYG